MDDDVKSSQKLERRCVSCQSVAPRDRFWRVVRVPHAEPQQFHVQLDVGMGRSAYICQSLDCLQIAQKKNRLGRSLKMPIPKEILEILKSRLS
jgi:hypothetical protein